MTAPPGQTLDVSGLCSLSPGSSTLLLHIDGVHGSDLLRGRQRPERLLATVRRPGRPGDLIGFGSAGVHIMSDRMRSVLERSGLTGWFAHRIDVDADVFDGPIWVLGVSGRSGPTYSAARNPLPGLPRLGEFLDPSDWDGSDFFCPDNLNGFLITATAAAALRKARLRNLYMECGSLEQLPRPR